MKQKMESLQALRALAFIGIFLRHAGSEVSWPALGVSIFFVLSGFFMILTYEDRKLSCSIKTNLSFSINKIKKIYPLHIITMICILPLMLLLYIRSGITIKRIAILFAEIIMNMTLTQTWFPYSSINASLNGVAWFLSAMLFLYFMFPYIKKILSAKTTRWMLIMSIVILALEILVCIPFILILGKDSPVYVWFMYYFPVFRLGDFFIGCCLGKYYLENGFSAKSTKFVTLYELVTLVVTVFVMLWLKIEQPSMVLLSFHNLTTIWIPISVLWIYFFARNQGYLTRFLTNKVLVFIGDISVYTFLIHYVITQYTVIGLAFLGIELQGVMKYIMILMEFSLTIFVSKLYQRLHDRGLFFKI